MTSWSQALPYFTEKELGCKCCGLVKLDLRFAAMLPRLRQEWGKPLVANSVCRCPAHNKKINSGKGGHPTSLHLTDNSKWPTTGTAAADIAWRHWEKAEKLQFARLAHAQGFRVGLHNGFLHVDLGRVLGMSPKPFVYGEWANVFNPEDIL